MGNLAKKLYHIFYPTGIWADCYCQKQFKGMAEYIKLNCSTAPPSIDELVEIGRAAYKDESDVCSWRNQTSENQDKWRAQAGAIRDACVSTRTPVDCNEVLSFICTFDPDSEDTLLGENVAVSSDKKSVRFRVQRKS